MAEFLLEIGLEEVPARMIAGAQAELLRRVTSVLCAQNLMAATDVTLAKSYSTPRRLAVYVPNISERQPDSFAKLLGPSAKIAFKDGQPTAAAEAFARKNGLAVSELKIESTDKGDYVVAETETKGRSAAEVIASELPKEIGAIYWAKSMYWRPGKPERFVRPVLWIACLLGDEIVPLQFAGKTAGRETYGHRVLAGDAAIEIESPGSYVAQLGKAYVCADVEVRRQRIRKALDHVTRKVAGARWREDEALVDAVTHLTEWPDVLLGNFEPEYLALPEEVLVTVMRDHQKYFAVEDAAGKLAPHFLAVLNIETDAKSEAIIRQGNERVLRARFNDARFFWEFDQRVPLVERVKLLENVTFQKDLGTYRKKAERVRELCHSLAWKTDLFAPQLEANAILDAASLAKTDLTTELVKEFTELQGIIGGLYARSQGVSDRTADAIYDQYLPASASDPIPRSMEGQILGLADRISTIVDMFSLGFEPTGSKDPFALRRAANGIVRILAESELPLKLSDVLNLAMPTAEDFIAQQQIKKSLGNLSTFFAERIDFYLREVRGQAYDVVKAVMAAGADDLRDLVARAESVTAVRGGEDFLAVSAAFKRMKNILDQARAKGDDVTAVVDADLLLDASEKMLSVTAGAAASAVELLQAERKYTEALSIIATLRPVIDDFFEKVMVMSPELDIRANRLALLARTLGDFSKIADFSEIVVAG